MDIQGMLDVIKDIRKSNAANLTIEQMLRKLNEFNDDEKVTFTDGKHFDGTYDSYRGYYEDLYLGRGTEDQGLDTVGNLKSILTKALEDGVMVGYKGGEFSIDYDTLIWFSEYGNTGDMIIDVLKINDSIIVITKEDEW